MKRILDSFFGKKNRVLNIIIFNIIFNRLPIWYQSIQYIKELLLLILTQVMKLEIRTYYNMVSNNNNIFNFLKYKVYYKTLGIFYQWYL